MSNTDRIEKKMVLRAPRARVWRAITDAEQFGTWFRAKFETAFVEGKPAIGRITHGGYEHLKMEIWVERIEPERLFSFRWHPYAVEPKKDYSAEPTTLVEFQLEEAPEGTVLTVTESGFDHIPAERRAEAFRMNEGGWAAQLENVQAYVAATS
ncbi:MAG TPA: SRPBCC family protein [Polyangiaceae bacterium]|jgi:uncharacterized protein YndB with AHSA1/START domain|nr:SRPBCC family protein [Polyangiaceae bacterium]